MRFLFAVLCSLTLVAALLPASNNPVYVHARTHKAKKHKVPKHRTMQS